MSSSKDQEAQTEREAARQADAPPAYEHIDSGSTETKTLDDKCQPSVGPTPDSPFNFPSDAPLPTYSEASGSSSQKLIIIPQTKPDPTAPLLAAFAPALLRYGIPKHTWLSFLDSVSSFLSPKVTDIALRHASSVGQQVGEVPKDVFKGIYNHVKDTGKNISSCAKRGNIIGAAAGVVGGAITIPIHAATGIVRTGLGMPVSAMQAAAKKPETSPERAVAYYFGVTNKDWLNKRGLHVSLLDSQQVSQLVGVSVVEKMELHDAKDQSPKAKLGALEEYIAKLEVDESATLSVGPKTLWLVLTQVEPTKS